jgi:hypothetical protein
MLKNTVLLLTGNIRMMMKIKDYLMKSIKVVFIQSLPPFFGEYTLHFHP